MTDVAAAPGILLPAENVAELIEPAVAPYVWTAEHSPWRNEQRHEWVRESVLAAAPLLKHSIKEIRGVPDELLAVGVDLAIRALCRAIKEVLS